MNIFSWLLDPVLQTFLLNFCYELLVPRFLQSTFSTPIARNILQNFVTNSFMQK